MGQYKRRQILIGNDSGSSEQRYYAFPSLLRLNDGNILIAYKNGEKHLSDRSAPLETVVIEPHTGEILSKQTVDHRTDWIHQNPELMRMPDGSILLYVDIQQGNARKTRLGLRVYRSNDEGASFQDVGWFPQVGPFVYGYSFDDALSQDGAVNMLVMSFPELQGGIRAVHAVRTHDHGETWSYIRNLNEEFECAFNESSLLTYKDHLIIITRGDDQVTRAFRTNQEFQVVVKRDLSAEYDGIEYIGRPELLEVEGQYYILCRNIEKGKKTGTLQLYHIDPESLEIRGQVRLDVNESVAGDSYYAEHYMVERDGVPYINVITYVPATPSDKPDIVRMEFSWIELTRMMGSSKY